MVVCFWPWVYHMENKSPTPTNPQDLGVFYWFSGFLPFPVGFFPIFQAISAPEDLQLALR